MVEITNATLIPKKGSIRYIDPDVDKELMDWIQRVSGRRSNPIKIEVSHTKLPGSDAEWIKISYTFDLCDEQVFYYNNTFLEEYNPMAKKLVSTVG